MITCKICQWIIRKLKPKPKGKVYSDDVRVDYPKGRHIPEWYMSSYGRILITVNQ